jgi:hypothetical protein
MNVSIFKEQIEVKKNTQVAARKKTREREIK